MPKPDTSLFRDLGKFSKIFEPEKFWDPGNEKREGRYTGVLGTAISAQPEEDVAEERLRKLFVLAKSLRVPEEHAAYLAELALRHIKGFRVEQRGRPKETTLEDKRKLVAAVDDEIRRTGCFDKVAVAAFNREHGTNYSPSRLSEARRAVADSDMLREKNPQFMAFLVRLGRQHDRSPHKS